MNILTNLGLSNYEGKALEVLLKRSLNANDVSAAAKIPAGKVYGILNSLLSKKLIEETVTRPKQYFVSDADKTIKMLISQKENETENILSQARQLSIDASRIKNQKSLFFQTGITANDNREIQLRAFRESTKEVCQIINVHHKPKSNRQNKLIWENEIKSAIERGVKFKCIYPVDAKLPLILQNLPKDKFIVRRLDLDFTRCDIIDGKKVLLKLVHADAMNFGGIIFLEDEAFARNLRQVFEQFWQEAK